MSSYNRINGVYGSEYKKGYDVLRKEFMFGGMIVSDWDAVRDRTRAAKAGLDLEMPFHSEHYEQLCRDYENGMIDEEEIDVCAERVLDSIYRCKDMQAGKKRTHSPKERIAFTQTVVEEGIVVLKNNGVLPLKQNVKLSMCGLFARPCAYSEKKPQLITGGGSGKVERFTPMFDLLELLERETGRNILYETAFGADGVDSAFMKPGNAVENAAETDVNLVFVGTGADIEYEGNDRREMGLGNAAAVRTILDTSAVNENTVVIIFAGAPIDMHEWIDHVAAVVYVGFPGERGGEAIVNVLTGKVNPSGKLTETFPLRYEDTPAANTYLDSKVTRYQEGLDVGYRYYDTYKVDVLFPFGYGLSYTTFYYSDLRFVVTEEGVQVCYTLSNTGKADGKEVSQVYIHPCSSYFYHPSKELKGFSKDMVQTGGETKVCVFLGIDSFACWSTAQDQWIVEDGIYEILVGASSADIRLRGKIKIINGKIVLL